MFTIYSMATLVVSAISCVLIAILGTVGNLMAVISLLRSPRLRKSSTYYIVNLSMSNLPMCIVAMPLAGYWFSEILLYNEFTANGTVLRCVIVTGLICNQAELQTICVLGFNRVLAMTLPEWYRYLAQTRSYIYVLLGIWIYSIVLWIPLASGLVSQLTINSTTLYVKIGEDKSLAKRFYLVIGFALPITFSLVCHAIILFKGLRLGKNSDSASRVQWRHHVTKTVGLVFLLLIVLSVPHATAHALHPDHVNMPNMWLLFHILFFSRYVWDPVVFVSISGEYRRAFLEFLSWMFPKVWSPSSHLSTGGGMVAPPCTPAARHKLVDMSSPDFNSGTISSKTRAELKASRNRKPSHDDNPQLAVDLV